MRPEFSSTFASETKRIRWYAARERRCGRRGALTDRPLLHRRQARLSSAMEVDQGDGAPVRGSQNLIKQLLTERERMLKMLGTIRKLTVNRSDFHYLVTSLAVMAFPKSVVREALGLSESTIMQYRAANAASAETVPALPMAPRPISRERTQSDGRLFREAMQEVTQLFMHEKHVRVCYRGQHDGGTHVRVELRTTKMLVYQAYREEQLRTGRAPVALSTFYELAPSYLKPAGTSLFACKSCKGWDHIVDEIERLFPSIGKAIGNVVQYRRLVSIASGEPVVRYKSDVGEPNLMVGVHRMLDVAKLHVAELRAQSLTDSHPTLSYMGCGRFPL
jgi:hypothetical protein